MKTQLFVLMSVLSTGCAFEEEIYGDAIVQIQPVGGAEGVVMDTTAVGVTLYRRLDGAAYLEIIASARGGLCMDRIGTYMVFTQGIGSSGVDEGTRIEFQDSHQGGQWSARWSDEDAPVFIKRRGNFSQIIDLDFRCDDQGPIPHVVTMEWDVGDETRLEEWGVL